jgi:small subunit ribosomal protein S25e
MNRKIMLLTNATESSRGKSIRNRFFLNIQMRNMGGGKKKQSLKQMKRKGEKKERKESKSKGSTTEKKSIGIVPPDPKSKEVTDQLKKMKVLTPYTVAARFDLRLSVAKTFLKELEKQGVIEFISGSKNTKIYKPAD